MPEPPPGYSARQRLGSRRLIIVASRHDLRLRTITRVPCGHSFGAGSLKAGAASVATGAGCDAASAVAGSVAAGAGCDAASVGDAAAGWSAEAWAISVSTSSVVGAVLAD